MNGVALRTADLTIGYRHGARGTTVVASGLSLELRHEEVVCLVGPNGVGKSTLLRTVTGLQESLGGEVTIDGVDIRALDRKSRARSIGVVLTERVNVGMLPAFDLVSLGRQPHTEWTGRLGDRDVRAVQWALEAVGAEELSSRLVNELSDGERQKVMIARALAQEPSIVVLDEPTAFLDLPRRVETMGLLKQLARTTGRAILLSTHDLDLAIRASDRLWLMEPGGVVHTGAPEDLVLNGALESVFAGVGVAFDREHGSFHLVTETRGCVRLVGDGEAAAWTARALRREGFEVSKREERCLCTVVVCKEDPPAWRIEPIRTVGASPSAGEISASGRVDSGVSEEGAVSRVGPTASGPVHCDSIHELVSTIRRL